MLRKYCELIAPLYRLSLLRQIAPKNGVFIINKRDFETGKEVIPAGYNGILGPMCSRNFHSSLPRSGRDSRRELLASIPKKDEGTEGERTVDVDSVVASSPNLIPNAQTFTTLFNGIPFKDIPIMNITATRNNTTISLSTGNGEVLMINSSGREGFKKARKGTNIAAQAAAISLAMKASEKGHKTVRVRVGGLGPGRLSAIKGLQMGGLNIVSVTDNTPVSWNPPRPRKQRKL